MIKQKSNMNIRLGNKTVKSMEYPDCRCNYPSTFTIDKDNSTPANRTLSRPTVRERKNKLSGSISF